MSDPDPRPAVFEEQCNTCIFRPGNPMQLMPGRLKDVVQSNLFNGTLLVCHKTTYGQAEESVLCKGFFDKYGPQTAAYQILHRLGGSFRTVPLPEDSHAEEG